MFSVQQGHRASHQSNTMYMTWQLKCSVIIFAFTSLKIYIVNHMKIIIHGVLNSVSFYVWSIKLVAILYTTLFILFNSGKVQKTDSAAKHEPKYIPHVISTLYSLPLKSLLRVLCWNIMTRRGLFCLSLNLTSVYRPKLHMNCATGGHCALSGWKNPKMCLGDCLWLRPKINWRERLWAPLNKKETDFMQAFLFERLSDTQWSLELHAFYETRRYNTVLSRVRIQAT